MNFNQRIRQEIDKLLEESYSMRTQNSVVLDNFKKDINKNHKKLTREEERDLIPKAQNGDEAARETLMFSVLPMVLWVATKFRNAPVDIEDLISSGCYGALKAINVYDMENKKRIKFSTYAHQWIWAEIRRFVVVNKDLVEIPEYKTNEVSVHTMYMDGLSEPAQKWVEGTYMNMNIDADIEETIDFEKSVEDLLAVLSPIERQVMEMKFGLTGNGEMSLQDIGKSFGVSRQRIYAIKERSLRKMRGALKRFPSANEEIRCLLT